MQIAVNKGVKPHFSEKIINKCIELAESQYEVIVPVVKAKSWQEIHDEGAKMYYLKGKKIKPRKGYGMKVKDFNNLMDYNRELQSRKNYEQMKADRNFHNEQVNATIFAAEGTEGDLI